MSVFNLARERKAWWDVEIKVPKDRGVDRMTVSFLFSLLDEEGLKELMASPDPVKVIAAHIHGWQDIAAENGEALPVTPENTRAILRELFVQGPVGEALIACSRGTAPKNSAPGSAG